MLRLRDGATFAVVDAQIHPPPAVAAWRGDATVLAAELAREAMDCVGVDAALVVAPEDQCRAFVDRYPERFRGCPRIPDATAPDVPDLIRRSSADSRMVGVRAVLREWQEGALIEGFAAGSCDPLFETVRECGIPLFVQAAGHLRALAPVLERYSDVLFVLDHIGLNQQPSVIAEDPWEDLPEVIGMARYPNVGLKLSGAITLSSQAFPHDDLWPRLLPLISAFGAERVMWGSDFTRLRFAPRSVTRGERSGWYGTYADSVGFLRETTELSTADKQTILSGTIIRLLGWAVDDSIAVER